MSKHTPGPWHIAVMESPDDDIDVRAHMNTQIARLWLDDAPDYEWNDQQRANARLIAAAPDMHEKIEDALKEWDILPRDRPFTLAEVTDWLTRYMAPAMDGLRAAIAKAEGKS